MLSITKWKKAVQIINKGRRNRNLRKYLNSCWIFSINRVNLMQVLIKDCRLRWSKLKRVIPRHHWSEGIREKRYIMLMIQRKDNNYNEINALLAIFYILDIQNTELKTISWSLTYLELMNVNWIFCPKSDG